MPKKIIEYLIDSDESLVNKIITGDIFSFEKLYGRYSKDLLNFAVSYLNSSQVAEDIVQDIFINIWIKRKSLKAELSIKSYLFTAVRYQALKHIRNQKGRQENLNTMSTAKIEIITPESLLLQNELKEILYSTIEDLPDKCREIFCMKCIEKLSYSEIAETLEISINTVKTQMGRAYKTLRKKLSYLLE